MTTATLAVTGVTAVAGAVVSAPAAAAPGSATAARASILSIKKVTTTRSRVTVYSPSMRRTIALDVLTPAARSGKRPTLYLLDGIDAGSSTNFAQSDWLRATDVEKFFADKQVTVVLPIGGPASYYTDWNRTDPTLGRYAWETLLTTELRPVIEAAFDGNGRRALAGASMGASGALTLAARHPGQYRAVAAFSGCLNLLSAEGTAVTVTGISGKGGNPNNMWGPPGSAGWRAHDPSTNVKGLRGTYVYVSAGDGRGDSGVALSPTDKIAAPIGAAYEVGALTCTRGFLSAATRAKVPVTFDLHRGYHMWAFWSRDIKRAWPGIDKALSTR
ncbi:alpha/beta hydrolase family protein [Williamsia sp. CHRR-6]|uniref:alpha/beta hydrolase n=1 Tax=Williamsia sp. CHRR-6 TaxID=2835871 RepID=UPI001BDA0F58|nr:alpha/beta hydrolase family protein [Williamsia sp. CHRR-6]MBT0565333.1 esterase family protein [Williamsia sp. CHRR-6]